MGEQTNIEWCDHTFNPWRGCTKVSPGCTHCYAETLSLRNPGVLGKWGPNGVRAVASESYWRKAACWDAAAVRDGVRRRVFFSLGDWLEDRADLIRPRRRFLDTICHTPALDWLLLTKRPELWESVLSKTLEEWVNSGDLARDDFGYHQVWQWLNVDEKRDKGYPLHNAWVGVSVEDRRYGLPRIERLREIPATLRFLSVEPLLQDLGFLRLEEVDWVIIGGESGTSARPCDIHWIRAVVRQCWFAGIPAFVKQLGSNPVEGGKPLRLRDSKGGDPSEWPEDLRIREWPASPAGAIA
jgi:protein gp37